jgi:hypothetical protein
MSSDYYREHWNGRASTWAAGMHMLAAASKTEQCLLIACVYTARCLRL